MPNLKFKDGDLVKWREEWIMHDEERDMVFVCREPADDGKCFIQPVEHNFFITPSFMTNMDYLELA